MRRVCCLFACLLPVIILFSYSMRVCICFFLLFFLFIMHHRSGFDYCVEIACVNTIFSRVSSWWIKVIFICTEVMLFINSTFQWKLSVMKGREKKKLHLFFNFTPKLVEHSLWHRGKKNDLIVFIHRFVITNHLLFFFHDNRQIPWITHHKI